MSGTLDGRLIRTTLYLCDVAFMKNPVYDGLLPAMTGASLRAHLIAHSQRESKGTPDIGLADFVSENFVVVGSVADPKSIGLNAILFKDKADGTYYLASDGVDIGFNLEFLKDSVASCFYAGHFRERGGATGQLRSILDLIDRYLPDDQSVILTGQSQGGANSTAAALLLGDKVEAVVAYNAPNPTGWSSLSNGDFVAIGETRGRRGERRYDVEIVASDVDSSRIYQIQNIGDLLAGRVFRDSAVTEGISIGTVYRLDAQPLRDRKASITGFYATHTISATRSVVDDPRYFSEATGFTEAVSVRVLNGDSRLREVMASGRVAALKLSRFDPDKGLRPILSVRESVGKGGDKDGATSLNRALACYSEGKLLSTEDRRDPGAIAATVEAFFASDRRVRIELGDLAAATRKAPGWVAVSERKPDA
ncbi:MAG: hypothetical protein Kilf2KO_08940 [Rhodospirillales bacterium]